MTASAPSRSGDSDPTRRAPAAQPDTLGTAPAVLRTPGGQHFSIIGGSPTPEDVVAVACAIDRLTAQDDEPGLGPWTRSGRPGGRLATFPQGARWTGSARNWFDATRRM